MRFLLVGAFIVLLVILYSRTSRTEGFANADKCKQALSNLTAVAEMPYFAQNDPTIFANRVDKALNTYKNLKCSGKSGGIPQSQFSGYYSRLFSAYNVNNDYCNIKKCDKGRKLLIESIASSMLYINVYNFQVDTGGIPVRYQY